MRLAPDNLIKEEPSAGGVAEGLVVESAVGALSSIGGDGAEEAFFDGDADGATDRHLASIVLRHRLSSNNRRGSHGLLTRS